MTPFVIAVALAIAPSFSIAADMKGMDMKDMSPTRMSKDDKSATHVTKGTVKKIDSAGIVTLDHEPVQSLKWPAMTMGFKVKDKALMKKLETGKRVEVEFEQRGKDYVITRVK